ncbi:PleD family two-component system response regulator [Patescibacteria group bacterium]
MAIKIVHFEDDPLLGDMYKVNFVKPLFDYVQHSNPPQEGEELIKLVVKEKPDLILMDMVMPVMDGIEATRVLKSDKRTRNFPIVGLSNLTDPKEKQRGLDLGMKDYLIAANYMPAELVKKVCEILEVEPKK